jgi:exonuclease VII large subunit/OB-fold nucleic acid binding protein
MPDNALPQRQVISVSELNRMAREALERGLPLMWIAGEVSNCKRYDSGHCYFTLKDAQAQVDCVMFRHRAQLLGWLPKDGEQVEVRALPTLYEARGKFQLNVEVLRRAGLGALYEAFERLKAKLDREGLFDAERKRPLARFPRAIGVVTSPRAAALRDVLTTLRRRMPRLPAILYPAPVQGEGAAERIAAAIALAGARQECDVLIVCRGGGSIEDLWAFNEEIVARAIVALRTGGRRHRPPPLKWRARAARSCRSRWPNPPAGCCAWPRARWRSACSASTSCRAAWCTRERRSAASRASCGISPGAFSARGSAGWGTWARRRRNWRGGCGRAGGGSSTPRRHCWRASTPTCST